MGGRGERERERKGETVASCQAASRKRVAEESAAGEPAKVARLESSVLEGSSPGAESLESQGRAASREAAASRLRQESRLASKRSLAVVQESLGGATKGPPVYYRLDFLWGKTPEKEAKPGLSPDTYREREDRLQQEGIEKVEQKAKEVASSLGMAGAVVPASRNKGGRPKGRKNKAKAQAGLRKREQT